ncbi:MAG: T9SS type A sorting domain-containing protein [Bacteroidetes bacterium]|nr:T9SS type A sorting domain-containing protein [Bacteroidota bacterium]
MKKILLFSISMLFIMSIYAQERATVSKNLRNWSVQKEKTAPVDGSELVTGNAVPVKAANFWTEDQIGDTWYDKQSNRSMANRLYLYDDGTMATTWTFSQETSGYSDRGAGYNYFDGEEWGEWPEARVETVKSGWPSYSPLGENGEIIVSHNAVDALIINRRAEKGSGDWTESILQGPAGFEKITWPRVITTGVDQNIVHVLGIIRDYPAAGDYTLGYYRSSDGGEIWDIMHEEIPGTGHDFYTDLGADSYVFAEPRDGIIAFGVFNIWCDMFIMKSTDDGETWEKTVVWEHPYPFYGDETIFTDTLWSPDNSGAIAIDKNGKIHITFGIAFVGKWEVGTTYSYWPGLSNGIGYWNEDMDPFTAENQHDALDPEETLIEDVNLIGWSQDLDNSGELEFVDIVAYSEIGLCTMPTMVIDENNHIFVAYAATTEGFDNGTYNFKHVWARTSPDGGLSWGNHFDLTDDLIHIFDECVYPMFAQNSDASLYLHYNVDSGPGNGIDGDHDPTQNIQVFSTILKDDILGVDESYDFNAEQVSQNYPNPFTGQSIVEVSLQQPADIYLEVSNLLGQVVYRTETQKAGVGKSLLTIDAAGLEKGVYIYSVYAGKQKVNKKLIIE